MCLCGKDEIPACVCAGSGAGAGRLGAMATRPARGAGIPEHRRPRGCAAPNGILTPAQTRLMAFPVPMGMFPWCLWSQLMGELCLLKRRGRSTRWGLLLVYDRPQSSTAFRCHHQKFRNTWKWILLMVGFPGSFCSRAQHRMAPTPLSTPRGARSCCEEAARRRLALRGCCWHIFWDESWLSQRKMWIIRALAARHRVLPAGRTRAVAPSDLTGVGPRGDLWKTKN